MKRLMLMGGRPWLGPDRGKNFAETLFRDHPERVNLAFCIFAQPENEWDETLSVNMQMFDKHGHGRAINQQVMTAENFVEVSKWADIIYIPGGNPYALKDKITAQGNAGKLWDGKVVAGSSAGADVLCRGFTYLQEKTFGEGFGWVHATCIPHWRSNFNGYTSDDWDWAEQECLRRFPELPVLCIQESQFVEFTVGP